MYREILQNRNYQKLLAANAANCFGDSIDAIAFTWLAYTSTESASLSALVFAANVLPTALFQPLVAPLIDKLKKQSVMVWADWLRALFLTGFIALLLNGLLSPWMFVAFTFSINTIEAFRIPAGVSFMPKFLEGDALDRGINLNQIACRACELAGTAAGGILAAFSPILAMGIDLFTFLLSGTLIARMSVKETIDDTVLGNTYWANLKDGFRYLRENRAFRIFVITALLSNMIAAVFSSLSTAYVSGVLHASPVYLSSANMILTVCGLAMVWLYPKLSRYLRPSVILTWFSFGASGLSYLALAFLPRLGGTIRTAAWLLLFLLIGISTGIFGAFLNIIFVKVVEQAYLARAAGVFNSAVTMSMPVVSVLLAGAVPFVGIPFLMGAAGFLSLAIFVILVLGKNCRILDGMI